MLGYSFSLPKTNFVFLNTDLGFYCLLVFIQFMYSLIKKRLLKSINRLKKGHNRRKTNKF